MFRVQENWPLVGRTDELNSLRLALQDEGSRGAIVTGQAGVGKTSLAQHAARQLEQDFELVYVRGTAIASGMAYGALNFVLSELDDEAVDNPLMLLRSLQVRFAKRTGGRQTLMLVDNAEDLDSASAMAIAHLVRVDAVRVLLLCQSLGGAPDEFGDLWKDGLLSRVDVAPLGLGSTAQLLAAGLGGPVSRSVVLEMWRASGGNPLFLAAISREQRDSGYLTVQDGIWVGSTRQAPNPGRSITEWISARFARLPKPQREAAEMVSIVGAIPLDLLAGFADADSVDALLEHGIIRVDITQAPVVRIANSLVGEVIRKQVPRGRSRGLLHTIAVAALQRSTQAISRMTYALWCLDCGMELKPELAIDAAQLANRHFDTPAALRFLKSIPAGSYSAAAVTEEARAYGIQGEISRAVQILDNYLASHQPDRDLTEGVRLQLLRCQLLTRSHQRFGEVDDLIEGIQRRLLAEVGSEEEDISGLLSETELLVAELGAYNGKYIVLADTLSELLKHNTTMDPAVRHQLCCWLAEALCMTGRQDEAVSLCRLVMSRLADTGGDPLLAEAAQAQLFSVLLVSGNWNECLAILVHHDEEPLAGKYDGSSSELAEGCLYAYAGRGKEALEKLLPALSQLRIRDRHQLRVLAEAATAYAYALVGDARESMRHLEFVEFDSHRLDWPTYRATRYFAALALTATHDPLDVARRLVSLADEDRAEGNGGHELFFLCQAVQLGLAEVAERLATSGTDGQGVFARTCALYGKGVASGDTDQILRAARSAAASGNHRLASDAANLVRTLSRGTGDKQAAAAADAILVALGRLGSGTEQRALGKLTERERSIALRVASGSTNRDIAEMLTLSIRTVEGHMYQVYSKLGVANRSQLRAILE